MSIWSGTHFEELVVNLKKLQDVVSQTRPSLFFYGSINQSKRRVLIGLRYAKVSNIGRKKIR